MNHYKKSYSSNSPELVSTIVLNIYKYLISVLFLFPVLVYAQEYNSYTMFDNFEIVAPSTPTVMINTKAIKMYSSKIDKDTAIIITKLGTGLESDIGEYNEKIKQLMDQSTKQGEDVAGNSVTRFSSTLDRKKNTYIATYFVAPKKAGDGPYMAKKSIVKGKTDYTWYVTSYVKKDVETIFNKYEDRIKFIYNNEKSSKPNVKALQEYDVKALQKFKNACDLNNGNGCNNLGLAYRKGKEVKKDDAKAAYFLQKSCELNIGNGCYNLGFMFQEGAWVKKDISIAYKFYQKAHALYYKACRSGDMAACHNLAQSYHSGRGVKQDYKKAVQMYEIVCKGGPGSGNAAVCYKLALLYKNGNGIEQDKSKAKHLTRYACSLGHQKACNANRKINEDNSTKTPKTKHFDKMLFEVSSRINANLPMTINSETEIYSTTPGPNQLTYHLRLVNTLKKNVNVEIFKEKMTPQIRNTFCTSEDMAAIREMGSIAIYRYVDKNHNEITSVTVDTKTCK